MLDLANLPQSDKSVIFDYANSRNIPPSLICNRGSAVITQGVSAFSVTAPNTPRLDYKDSVCKGLLTEANFVNLMPNSKLEVDTHWGGGNLNSTFNLDSPIPGARSVELVCRETTAVTSKGVRQYISGLQTNARFVMSFFVKPDFSGGKFTLRLRHALQATGSVEMIYGGAYWNDFVEEVSGNNGCEYIGGGWYRMWYSFTTGADTERTDVGLWVGDENRGFQYTQGGYKFLMTAPQLELGNAPRSPIITTPNQTAGVVNETNIIDVGPYLSSQGFTVACVATSNFSSEYQLIFSDAIETLGNYIGLRHASSGSYINSIEGGRGNAIARPALNKKVVSVASFSDESCIAIVNGQMTVANGVKPVGTDYSLRRYMKHNQIIGTSLGKCVHERVAIWNRPMSEQELKSIYAAFS